MHQEKEQEESATEYRLVSQGLKNSRTEPIEQEVIYTCEQAPFTLARPLWMCVLVLQSGNVFYP